VINTLTGSKSMALSRLFTTPKPIIGTIHSLPLPGSPRYAGESLQALTDYALRDARTYVQGGADGLILENSGDLPFAKPDEIGDETVAAMAVIAASIRRELPVPLGINCLANAAMAGLAVAKASGATFIRVNQYVNGYVANEGFIEGKSGQIARYRAWLRANDEVAIFADVHVKHGSHAVVADRTLDEQARDAEFFDADVLIATGNRTGDATPIDEVEGIRAGTVLPVIIGSGLNVNNARRLLSAADGAIIGSALKYDGVWWQPVELERVQKFMAEVRSIRTGKGE